MIRNPRQLAVEALISAEQGGYSNLILDRLLKNNSEISAADEALFTALFYGTVERLRTIEIILGRYSTLPVEKMKPEIRAILSISVYQILFCDKIPISAAVNEAVKLVKQGKFKQLSGFVNAVLRNVARNREDLLQELNKTSDLSLKYACAPSLARELTAQYGKEDAEAFLAAGLHKPPVYVRKNTLLSDGFSQPQAFLETELKSCYILTDPRNALRSQDFKNGLFHVEDMACQLACSALNVRSGERVLDVCAAPGGKTFTMAQYMENKGEIIACDLHQNRVRLIEQGAERLHISNIRAMVNDAREYKAELGEFDKVLCDVPCSGYGVIRRKPEIKQKETDEFEKLPEIQLKILSSSAKYLKKGGLLLYSTCTIRFSENESVVRRFLEQHNDYKIVTMRQLMPQTDNTDGFFYCLFER